jgi:hypothetical protein
MVLLDVDQKFPSQSAIIGSLTRVKEFPAHRVQLPWR